MTKRTKENVSSWKIGEKYEFYFHTNTRKSEGKFFTGILKKQHGTAWEVYFPGDHSSEIYLEKDLIRDWNNEEIRPPKPKKVKQSVSTTNTLTTIASSEQTLNSTTQSSSLASPVMSTSTPIVTTSSTSTSLLPSLVTSSQEFSSPSEADSNSTALISALPSQISTDISSSEQSSVSLTQAPESLPDDTSANSGHTLIDAYSKMITGGWKVCFKYKNLLTLQPIKPPFVYKSSTDYPSINTKYINENGTPFETFMSFFPELLRTCALAILTDCVNLRKESTKLKILKSGKKKKNFSMVPKIINIIKWIGVQILMENRITAFSSQKTFRDHFHDCSKFYRESGVIFPALNTIECLRSTFVPSVDDITKFQDLCTTVFSQNILLDMVHNIAIDESIFDCSARMENRKRSDVLKEATLDHRSTQNNLWKQRKNSLFPVPIANIPGKPHEGLQSISAAIKLSVHSQRSIAAEYQHTVKRGYFLGIYFLMHEQVEWIKMVNYYGTKFNVSPDSRKHIIMDARFSSEKLFHASVKCGWDITQSMRSDVPQYLWRVLDDVTNKNNYLVVYNQDLSVSASYFRDGDKKFRLWTTMLYPPMPEPNLTSHDPLSSKEECSKLLELQEEFLVKLVQKMGKEPVYPYNKLHLIYQLTGTELSITNESINSSVTNVTNNPTQSSKNWPISVMSLERLQQFSVTQLRKYLSKELYASVIVEMMEYFEFPKKKKKSENIEILIHKILPNSIQTQQQQEMKEFKSSLINSNCNDEASHHALYTENFNAVDLANKMWYIGNTPAFMCNAWTTRLFFYIIRIMLNNAWVLHETWESIDLCSFRESVGISLLKLDENELNKLN